MTFDDTTFTTAMRGYERTEVDVLIDRVERTLAGTAGVDAVTPEAIESAQFTIVLRGYRVEDVDDYLDRVVAQLKARVVEQADAEPPALVWGAEFVRERAALLRCAEEPAGQRFRRASAFGIGYAVAEVDAFVDRVRATVTLTLTSEEVTGVRFGTARRGYDESAVDEWREQVESFVGRVDRSG